MLSKKIDYNEPISVNKAIKECHVDLKPQTKSKVNGIIFLSKVFKNNDLKLDNLGLDVYFALQFKYLGKNEFKMYLGLIIR